MFTNSLTKTGRIIRNLVIFIVLLVGLFIFNKIGNQQNLENKEEIADTDKSINLCFYKKDVLDDFVGKYTLRLNLNNSQASGELKFLPAQKDSKIGFFEGTVSDLDQNLMGRRVYAFWDTRAEGMETKEELYIIFGEGTASIGFGVMRDRGDGVYVYENTEDIKYTLDLSDIACEDLDEIEKVEKYLRDNISVLSPVSSVLGGTWYVTTIDLDYFGNSGVVTYEDGHIQEKKNFTYEFTKEIGVFNMLLK